MQPGGISNWIRPPGLQEALSINPEDPAVDGRMIAIQL